MPSIPDRTALGLWLAFLVGSLTSSIAFVVIAPELVGPGHGAILGSGAIAGLTIAAVVAWRRADMFEGSGWWRRTRIACGVAALGAAGGASAAEHLNLGLPSRERFVVERPIVAKDSVHRRRVGTQYRVTTLATGPELATDRVVVSSTAWEGARPGQCLFSLRVRGALGADWIDGRAIDACDPHRGVPGAGVVVTHDADDWRWHRPDRRNERGLVVDHALPTGTRCRSWHDATWLYRCDDPAANRP